MMTMTDGLVRAVVAATGRSDAVIDTAVSRPLCEVTNATTQALTLHQGTLDDGSPWKLVAKMFRPLDESPIWEIIPESARAGAAQALDWLAERRVMDSGVSALLPHGVRMPHVWHVEQEDRRLTIWMEAVDDRQLWDLDRYRRTAHGLGRMAGGVSVRDAEQFGLGPRPLDNLFHGKICDRDLAMLRADWFWENEILRPVEVELRSRLLELGRRGPEMLSRLRELPVGLAHGDAAPGNLLETPEGSLVLIDCGYMNVGQLGGDLAQLLSGRALEGRAGAPLEAIAESVVDGYMNGLSEEGGQAGRSDVEAAFAIHLAMRALFDGLIFEGPPGSATAAAMEPRIELVRFGLDLVDRYLG